MNLVKEVLKISDSVGNELFSVDFFFSFKLSLLTSLLGQEGSTLTNEIGSKRESSEIVKGV